MHSIFLIHRFLLEKLLKILIPFKKFSEILNSKHGTGFDDESDEMRKCCSPVNE